MNLPRFCTAKAPDLMVIMVLLNCHQTVDYLTTEFLP